MIKTLSIKTFFYNTYTTERKTCFFMFFERYLVSKIKLLTILKRCFEYFKLKLGLIENLHIVYDIGY